MIRPRLTALAVFALLAMALVVFAIVRPLDHDESQYVAAAMLARHALVYRDFAYLQTPLQPILFAPLVDAAGAWAFPALRMVNAALGLLTAGLVYGATRRAGGTVATALIAVGLLVTADIFLFSAAVARNDMLPASLLAGAVMLLVAPSGGAFGVVMAGLLLSAATAAKLSYAFPALAIGLLSLIDHRRYRPVWLMVGAIPPALLVAATWHAAPDAFAFDVLRFPTAAPEQFYRAGRAWKLGWGIRIVDLVKFLALGPALLALAALWRAGRTTPTARLLDALILAGLIAALLPAPTWRQYLLPLLVPLAVRAALIWQDRPPRAGLRVALVVFALAGMAPSAVAVGTAIATEAPLLVAMRQGAQVRQIGDAAAIRGPVATLSPQFMPATGRSLDPRFAAGPFFFRSHQLIDAAAERRFALVSADRIAAAIAMRPPSAILTGGEAAWTSGDPRLDRQLAAAAVAAGYRPIAVPGTPFTWYRR